MHQFESCREHVKSDHCRGGDHKVRHHHRGERSSYERKEPYHGGVARQVRRIVRGRQAKRTVDIGVRGVERF